MLKVVAKNESNKSSEEMVNKLPEFDNMVIIGTPKEMEGVVGSIIGSFSLVDLLSIRSAFGEVQKELNNRIKIALSDSTPEKTAVHTAGDFDEVLNALNKFTEEMKGILNESTR